MAVGEWPGEARVGRREACPLCTWLDLPKATVRSGWKVTWPLTQPRGIPPSRSGLAVIPLSGGECALPSPWAEEATGWTNDPAAIT